jgi:hypothetical protein
MSLAGEVCYQLDLTGDFPTPPPKIIQGASFVMLFEAREDGEVIDLTLLDEIKVEAYRRFTSNEILFTATLANGKVTIVDAPTGRFDVTLNPPDTDYVGDMVFQILYHKISGETLKTDCCKLIFKPCPIVSDIENPEDPEVENFTLCDCPVNVQAGDLVYVSGAGSVDQALASDPAKTDIVGWVFDKPTTTTCRVTNDVGPVPSLGLIAGDPVYLSPLDPGKVTLTLPTLPDARIEVGTAKDASSYIFTGAQTIP